jgi:hypothetical protein
MTAWEDCGACENFYYLRAMKASYELSLFSTGVLIRGGSVAAPSSAAEVSIRGLVASLCQQGGVYAD